MKPYWLVTDYSQTWIDEKLYAKYNLPQDEINLTLQKSYRNGQKNQDKR